MTTLPTLFETFLSDIRPQDEHNDAYKEGHETLRDHLQNDDDIDEFYVADFLQGSYRRWTALRPQEDEKSDVDVVFVSDLSSDLDTDVALRKCEPFLDEHYEGQWEPNAHSYKIEEEEVEIDLVLTAAPSEATREAVKSLGSLDVGTALSPDDLSTVAEALNMSADGDDEWKDEPLKIPHRDENEWENTHPLATIAFTVNKNDITDGHYVNVVKAIKWWRRTKTPDVEGPTSYPLEHIVGQCCPDDIDSVAEGVTRTLEELTRQFKTDALAEETPVLPAHGLPRTPENDVLKQIDGKDFAAFYDEAEDAAALARTALDEEDKETSRDYWYQLFGEKFPPFGSDDDSDDGGKKAMSVGSSSQVEDPSDHQFAESDS
ncbi:hypothetical protein HZS55_14025 [Halosimplex rubrum]|uniref:Nucleotidyltransferase n=1 Tax=Halosimplex rubrum TaxID=869889 RepID=A0A7D5P5Q8_9EURY|nr:hypothetical protein [Halosimplex rubrum]QLH78345.1 hypothetical protein HZS55_14025 [Halosimplex rubrum]